MANFKIIRVLARKKSISLKKLSELLGMSEQGLQGIMANNSTTTNTLENLCKYLEVPVSVFFAEDEHLKNIGHKIRGNYSQITAKEIHNCQYELEKSLLEIKYLKTILTDKEKIICDKEEIIELLKKSF